MDALELVSETKDLVSLPEVATRIIGLVDDPKSTSDDVAAVIGRDPNLTARILRIANSAYYSVVAEVDTLSRAVTVLGGKQVRDLALGISAIRAFEGIPGDLVSMDDFWLHSIYCAIVGRSLAAETRPEISEAVFVAGLLHDIGQLLIFMKVPDLASQTLLLSVEGPDDYSMVDAERSILGFDHTEVGVALASSWHLPARLQECIAHHHQPDKAPTEPEVAAVVHIANSLAVLAELDSTDQYEAPAVDPIAWEITGLSHEIIPDVIGAARAELADVKSLFLM